MKLHDYEIEEIVLEILTKNEELKALIGDKITPVYIGKETEGDAVYYDSELASPETCKMGNVINVIHYYICAVSDKMDNANKIIGIIQDLLEGTFSNPYMRIRVVGAMKEGENLKYAKTMEFIIEW